MSIVNDFTRELGDKYREYLRDVSPMAPSMQTLGLLLELCVRGNIVLDLGSGFSSYALRYFADRLGIAIITVDDNSSWLEKTNKYCDAINTRDFAHNHLFITWSDLLTGFKEHAYSIVFIDLGTTRRRPNYYSTILSNYCSERSLILFDDMHKRPLRDAVTKALRPYDYIDIPVKDRTIDEFGRYCKLIFRLRPKERLNG